MLTQSGGQTMREMSRRQNLENVRLAKLIQIRMQTRRRGLRRCKKASSEKLSKQGRLLFKAKSMTRPGMYRLILWGSTLSCGLECLCTHQKNQSKRKNLRVRNANRARSVAALARLRPLLKVRIPTRRPRTLQRQFFARPRGLDLGRVRKT